MGTKLNDNEVREVAQMQMKIDTYESFISSIHAMITAKKTDLNYLLFDGTQFTEEMNRVWRFVKEKINASKESSKTA